MSSSKLILLFNRKSKNPYYQKIRTLFGSSLIAYWPLWEPAGTVANDISGNGHNGAYGASTAAPTPGAAGIGDGHTSTSFDGTNDYIDVQSAGLAAALVPTKGSLLLWLKVSAVAVWTDGTTDYAFEMSVNPQNRISILHGANNTITCAYRGGNVLKQVATGSLTSVGWLHFGLTWDTTAGASGEVKAYVNGAQSGTTQTSVTAFTGTPATSLIGILATTPDSPWKGYLSHLVLLNRAATLAEVATVANPL